MKLPAAKRRQPSPDDPQDTAQAGSHKATVLVVEDELDLQELLRYNLVRDGYRVICTDRGEEALTLIQQNKPDLVLLDLMLPGIDGLEVCRSLRQDNDYRDLPVIMLTAKSDESAVVAGLELGADDYIPKPFTARVLLARVKAVLRRGRKPVSVNSVQDENAPIQIGQLVIRPDRHEVAYDDQLIELTATEFKLLALLAKRPGRVFTRQQIITSIHGAQAAVTDRSVDVQVLHLRRKLGDSGDLIQAVRGVGYRFKDGE